ncbi:hypothetical protein DFH08DRAFT_964928 [Mycena albidolilacea]|uniref:RING-type domain-containing protein n=1 Tax=Mycena albidolilacea TaxID=1033008 RepID=A0AAD7ELG8_9AGAR|nr:hypothetical protein DFH08DRAFT_964928 [Mycena albidolilacea]
MDSLPRKKRLFSPKTEVRTGLLVFSSFPSEIIGDVPGFHTDQERRAHVRRVLQQREELTRAAGHRRMILQISLLDELIARGRSERKKARSILRREQKEAQDRANYEAWRLAHPPPPPTLRIVHRRGKCTARQEPLEEDDLYLDDARPGDISLPELEHTCRLCLNAKSHPVKLSCGHSACFVCVRLLLETQWGCDECGQVVTRRPQLDVEEVATIERAYPGWDQSKIAFGWEGLSFPAARR